MKLFYTRRSPYDEDEGVFAAKEGPFEVELAEMLFVEFGGGAAVTPWFGVMPPFDVLRDVLARGAEVDSANVLYEWTPFRLSKLEYEMLVKEVGSHPEWGIEIEFPPAEEEEWSHWALVRALKKRADEEAY